MRGTPFSTWLVVPLAILPIVGLLGAGADARWLGLGASSWIVAVATKIPVMAGLARIVAPAWIHGVLAGLASALLELGIALGALALASPAPSLPDILLFAVAAGSTEALIVLGVGAFVRSPPDVVATWTLAATRSPVIRHQVAVERSIAWLGHLGSRSLIALAFVRHVPALGFVAVATFAATDGLAAYLQLRNVDWFAEGILARYLAWAFCMVVIELVVLGLYLAIVA